MGKLGVEASMCPVMTMISPLSWLAIECLVPAQDTSGIRLEPPLDKFETPVKQELSQG